MSPEEVARLHADPRYRELVGRRDRLAWTLTAILLVAYFGFVLLIAFDKALLARPIAGGATSLGIPVGLALIVLTIVLTAIYVHRANRDFDALTDALRDEARR